METIIRELKNEELAPDLISDIIRNYPERNSWVAHNKYLPIEALRVLALDNKVDVRFTIAMKRKCDRSIFELLMLDSDFSVRMALVRNPKLPQDLLEKLTLDSKNKISEEAKRILDERIFYSTKMNNKK